MALKKLLDSLEGLSEELAKEYTKGDDGKYRLTVDGDDDYQELRGALSKERSDRKKEADERRKLVSRLEALGGIEALEEFDAERRELERKNLEKKGDYDKLLDQVKTEHSKELAKRDDAIKGLEGRLDQATRGKAIAEAVAKHGGNPALLAPILHQASSLKRLDSGEYEVQITVDGTVQVDKDGRSLSIEGYVERLKANADYAAAFKGSGASGGGGSGTPPPNGSGDGGRGEGGVLPELAGIKRSQLDGRAKGMLIQKIRQAHPDLSMEAALAEYQKAPF